MKESPVRQNIVETASRLFYEKGYNLTGINEIISEAGIAKATLYHHFKSKDDICLAYLQFKQQTFLKDLSVFMNKAEVGHAQLLAVFDFLDKFFKNNDFNGCWCINTVSEIPREKVKIRREIQWQKEQFIHLLQGFVQRNLPNTSEEKQLMLSKQIYLLYESAVAESHLHQDAWPIHTAKSLCAQLLSTS